MHSPDPIKDFPVWIFGPLNPDNFFPFQHRVEGHVSTQEGAVKRLKINGYRKTEKDTKYQQSFIL
ncbi:hypothetical protein EOI86_21015 [Hwanghaeella grinnelliae]|uniref:Uncharacterized protein n=1 Tax=Hwanghaeella grinnelliae TaxID=2500179 RepID=A0A3S2WNW2_9PROT|nr:hypothetical protein [Hwanghaeella grinnelliae]RVU33641.1 hypothetical protein EOI86_21015 [Hwanghaeella grinnelliae]